MLIGGSSCGRSERHGGGAGFPRTAPPRSLHQAAQLDTDNQLKATGNGEHAQGTEMRRRLKKKGWIIAGLTCLIAIGSAAAAFAYFTAGGTGVTHADSVGASSALTVSFGTPTGTMYPGAGSSAVPYTVTNAGAGQQQLTSVTAAVNADASGNITVSGTSVAGCKAAWFTASVGTPALPVVLTPSGSGATASFTGTLTVSMTDSGTNQNACQNQTPDVTVSAS
jgi:hypothetical protein